MRIEFGKYLQFLNFYIFTFLGGRCPLGAKQCLLQYYTGL